MTANLTNKNRPRIDIRHVAYLAGIIICAASIIGAVLVWSNHQDNPMDTAVSNDYWNQPAAHDQSVAGANADAWLPAQPPEALESRAEQLESFIGIALTSNHLYWYENGRISRIFPIIKNALAEKNESISTGQYEISYRNDRHLHADGSAYLPHMQQFGNSYGIHGWPVNRDRQKMPADYTGGSIWLHSDDAATVYKLASRGTPVVVAGENVASEQLSLPRPPVVTAKSYVIADVATGHIFARKSAHRPFPIASISKLITAVVAEDHINQDDSIYISRNAVNTHGRAGGLTAGQSLLHSTLQYPLLLDSSNDAATAIAEHIGFDQFIEQMNQKAQAIGMENTSFADPSGLSDANISTARDLFQLSQYLYAQRPDILEITTNTFQTVSDRYSDGLRNFTNNHPMAGQDNFQGGKNGYTGNARYTLLSIFRTESEDTERDIAIIILGSENYADDTRRLYQWVQRVL